MQAQIDDYNLMLKQSFEEKERLSQEMEQARYLVITPRRWGRRALLVLVSPSPFTVTAHRSPLTSHLSPSPFTVTAHRSPLTSHLSPSPSPSPSP